MSDLQSQVDRLYRRILMMVAPVQITTTNDTGNVLTAQIGVSNTPEVIDSVPLLQYYGFHANPPPKTDAIAVFGAGNRSNPVIVGTNSTQFRPRNYKAGEIGLFTAEGDTLKFAEQQAVTLTAGNSFTANTKQATIKGTTGVTLDTPNTHHTGDVKSDGKVDASRGFFQNGVPIGGGSGGGTEGPPGPTGATGPAGDDGNTVLHGTGAPPGTTGKDGDFYIDTTPHNIYGPKAGSWPTPGTSLVGPQGATGSQGVAGAQGPQGVPGPSGPTGPSGAAGPTGATGATGASGTSGPWTVGSIPYANTTSSLGQDNPNYFWDAANHRLGIGTTTPGFNLDVTGTLNASGNATFGNTIVAGSTITAGAGAGFGVTGSDVLMYHGGAGSLNIRTGLSGTDFFSYISGSNGDFGIQGNGIKPGGGSWAATSDIRLKEDVAEYSAGLAELLQLRPITYKHNGRGGTLRDGRVFVGLAADDVLPVMPEMVGKHSARLDLEDENEDDILTLDMTALPLALINAVRELQQQIDGLTRRLAALE